MAIKINGITVIDDSRVANVGSISQTGNVSVSAGGNANVAVVRGNGLIVTGAIEATGGFIGLDASKISNGTSEVAVIASGGNIRSNVGGATVQLIASDGVRITGIMSASGNITGGNLSGTSITGTLLTAAQTNITSVGTLSSLSVSGNVQGGNLRTAGLISATGGITGASLNTGTGNANVGNLGATSVVATNLTGTLQTAAQTNITSVGTLSSLSVSGNVQGGNLRTAGLISATGQITGSQFNGSGAGLTSIPNGALANSTVTVNGTAISLGGSGTVTANAATLTGTVLNATVVTSSLTSVGTLGSLSVTGNVQAGNLRTAGLVSATGAITGAAITGSSLTVSTGNVSCGNIVNTNANGVGNIGSSTLFFNTVFAKATSAQYADLAEMYLADQILEPGTVVCFGGVQEVTVCDQDASPRVAGVVSTNPSYIMNAGLAGDHPTAIALTGRVPTKVTGTVRKGDMMVAAGGGRARADVNPDIGTVIGKALADFDGQDGVIEVVIGRM
jgi:hypothetical protein